LFVAEFFDALCVNASDAVLLAVTDCALVFEDVLLFIVLKAFDVSLLYVLASVVEAFSEVVKLDAEVLLLVTLEAALTVN